MDALWYFAIKLFEGMENCQKKSPLSGPKSEGENWNRGDPKVYEWEIPKGLLITIMLWKAMYMYIHSYRKIVLDFYLKKHIELILLCCVYGSTININSIHFIFISYSYCCCSRRKRALQTRESKNWGVNSLCDEG